MSNLQTYYHFKIDFQKVDQHTGPGQVVNMFLNIKRTIFIFMLHLPALWYFDTSVTYPQWFCRVKFVVKPPRFVYDTSNICEILLYNRQWVAITHELISCVQAAHR